jgi:hypothetical protein
MSCKLGIALLSAVTVASLSTIAQAGTCPEEHQLSEPRELPQVGSTAVGRQVLAEVDLTG